MIGKLIKRWDEATWFMVFVIALDGVATFAGLNALGLYENTLFVSMFEAHPLMADLISSYGFLAIFTGIAWVFVTAYLYRERLTGFWKDAFWNFIVISHGLGALSWLIPSSLTNSFWEIIGNTWFNLLILEIVLALLLTSKTKKFIKAVF